jgi:23S rRNA maturation mini-RNase III
MSRTAAVAVAVAGVALLAHVGDAVAAGLVRDTVLLAAVARAIA